MLFQPIKKWRICLYQRHFRLYCDESLIQQIEWDKSVDISACFTKLLSQIPYRAPFLDSLEFVLDIPHLAYLLVPWQQGVTTPAERQAFTLALYCQQQGMLTGQLLVAFANFDFQQNGLAALMQKELFEAMRTLARRFRLRFLGCRTLFDIILKHFKKGLPENVLFACIGEEKSSFAVRYQHAWHSVFALHSPVTDVKKQLATANSLAGLPPIERYLLHSQRNNPLMKVETFSVSRNQS